MRIKNEDNIEDKGKIIKQIRTGELCYIHSLFIAQIIALILKQNLLQMSSAKIIMHVCLQCLMINHCQVLKWKKYTVGIDLLFPTFSENFLSLPIEEVSSVKYTYFC